MLTQYKILNIRVFTKFSHYYQVASAKSGRQDGEDRLHHQELPAAAAAALPDPGQGGQRGGRGQGQLRHGEGQQPGQNCQQTFVKFYIARRRL